MSLWRTWEVYERFTFFVSAKEYRSKTVVTHIEKTNTNVTCNHCQAKYDNLKCKTTDLLQVMTCIALKYIDMTRNCILDNLAISHFSKMQRTESVIRHLLHNNCTPNYAWVTLSPSGQLQNDYTYSHYVFISLVILKNRTYLRPSLGHIWTRCAFVDNFEFATNKAFDVSIGMSMLFWLGSFLKSSR